MRSRHAAKACRADRIDGTVDNRLVVVDYKSGTVPNGREVFDGEKPQLALEGALIQKGGFGADLTGREVSMLEYWKINGADEGGKVESRPMTSGKNKIETGELIDQTWEDLRTLIAAYQDQNKAFTARVIRNSDYIDLARQDEWEGGDHDV